MSSSLVKRSILFILTMVFLILSAYFVYSGIVSLNNGNGMYTSTLIERILSPNPNTELNPLFIIMIGGVLGVFFLIFFISFLKALKKK